MWPTPWPAGPDLAGPRAWTLAHRSPPISHRRCAEVPVDRSYRRPECAPQPADCARPPRRSNRAVHLDCVAILPCVLSRRLASRSRWYSTNLLSVVWPMIRSVWLWLLSMSVRQFRHAFRSMLWCAVCLVCAPIHGRPYAVHDCIYGQDHGTSVYSPTGWAAAVRQLPRMYYLGSMRRSYMYVYVG